jgi:hypothetical protein
MNPELYYALDNCEPDALLNKLLVLVELSTAAVIRPLERLIRLIEQSKFLCNFSPRCIVDL